MKIKYLAIPVLLAVAAFFGANQIYAQNSYGTIVGTVLDQSGAVIVGAQVTVRNTATGVVDTVQTQSDGGYTAINLIPGPYVVSVKHAGFNTTETSPVQLTVNQILRADVTLSPGSLQTTVEVSASETLLDTDTSSVTSEISNQQVTDLPLPSRNFMGLLAITAGTVYVSPSSGFVDDQGLFRTSLSGGGAYIGGARSSSNRYLIDGIDNNDPGFQSPTITMPIDAIGEISQMTDDYPADYGGSAAMVNVASKSGTNTFHGTAYDFLQNDYLNANDFYFGNPAAKPVVRYNQFGFSIGGPVWIPKVINGKNKLFFFADYEGTRQYGKVTADALMPTADELSGNFSADAPIYNPATGLQFPNNQITTINPIAENVINTGLFVTPNIPLTSTGINTTATLSVPDIINEWNIRLDYKIDAKDSIFVRYSNSGQYTLAPTIAPYGGVIHDQLGRNLGFSYIRLISPNLVNEVRIGFNRPLSLTEAQTTGNIASTLGFVGTSPASSEYGAPAIHFTGGYDTIGGNPNAPLDFTTTIYDVGDNLSLTKGAHSLKFGGDFHHMLFKEINAYEPNGLIYFDGEYTAGSLNPNGNPIADFLLGLSDEASVNQGGDTGWFNGIGYDFFAQDNWQVAKNLTVNLGLRYEYTAPLREEYNRIATFDPNIPGGGVETPDASLVQQLNDPLLALSPSEYDFNPERTNFAPRIGFSYRPLYRTVVRGGYGIFYDTFEYNYYSFSVLNPPFTKSYGAIGTVAQPLSLNGLFPVAPTAAPAVGMGVLSLDPKTRTPYVEQWNLGVERELPSNTVVKVSYMGSGGSKQTNELWLTQGVLSNPGPSATVVFPYPNMGYVIGEATGASSNYNALTAHFEKRFDHGYSFLANYTWSHALGRATVETLPQNTWNLRAEYGSLNYNISDNFQLSGTWDLPFGRGKAIAANAPYAANLLIGGWQLNGIYLAQSGFPFAIPAPYDNSGTGSQASRAEEISNPKASVPAGLAFNPLAFTEPAPGTFGNSSNSAVSGKGIDNADLSVFKNTYIHEGLNLQLQLEAFNAFNHTQPGFYPNTVITSPGVGTYDTLAHQNRTLQLAMKIIF